MKNIVPKSILTLLLSAIVMVGCQKDEVVLENSSKELIVTLSVPATTRVTMSETESSDIAVRWKEGDKLDFCFVSDNGSDIRTFKGVPVTNIQNDGATGQFALSIPIGLKIPFNLYGVYGASLEEGSTIFSLPSPPTNEVELEELESSVIFTFSAKEVGGAKPISSSIQFFGTMLGVWLDNPTGNSIEITDLSIDGGEYNWIEDISGEVLYDIDNKQFQNSVPSSEVTFLQDGSVTLGAGEGKKLYRWIVPSGSLDFEKELTININSTTVEQTLPALDFLYGRYYIVKLVYN